MANVYVLENQKEAERLEFQAKIPGYSIEDEFSDFHPTGKTLELGCGSGILSRYLVKNYPQINLTSTDISIERIQYCQNNNRNSNLSIDFQIADAAKLHFESNSFDVLVSRYMYHHISNVKDALKEAYRVLRKGGMIRIVDLDGIFLNMYTFDEKFNHSLTFLAKHIESDFFIGRKIPSYLHNLGFKNISWRVTHVTFDENTKTLELENINERLEFGRPVLEKVFGVKGAEDFSKKYKKYFQLTSTYYGHNCFVIDGMK